MTGQREHHRQQAHGQRQLHVPISASVAIGEVLKEKRDIAPLLVAPTSQFVGHIRGDVL
jgi:hypothetical protein